jgi:hypothetical protein
MLSLSPYLTAVDVMTVIRATTHQPPYLEHKILTTDSAVLGFIDKLCKGKEIG